MKGKKLLSVILSAMMVQSIVAATAISSSAAEVQSVVSQAEIEKESSEYSCNGYEYSLIDGNAKINKYKGGETVVKIPDKLDGYTVTIIGAQAFNKNKSITSVEIPDSVTEIGASAFNSCTNLSAISLGNEVTRIGISAFAYCYALTEVTIPDSVTNLDDYCFLSCTKLKEVSIGNKVSGMGYGVFYNCTSLEKVTIEEGAKVIGKNAFLNCSALASVTIPDTITEIGEQAFCNCGALKEVTIPDSVKSIGKSAFQYCKGMTSLTIGDGISTIEIGTFLGCENLTSVTIPDSVTAIGESCFVGCEKLTSVVIGNKVASMGDSCFQGCAGLKELTIKSGTTVIGNSAFLNCTSLSDVTIPGTVTQIGERAFQSCKALTDITIPLSVETIGKEAFDSCAALADVTLESGVATLGESAFRNCESLKSIAIPDSVTDIGANCFYRCTSLKEIHIPDSVKRIGAVDETSSDLTDTIVFGNCPADLTIYGIKDSFANKFADANNINFSIEETPVVTAKLTGDINLELEEVSPDVFTGTIDLEAGIYAFNIDDNGTIRGYDYQYNNTAVIDYSAGYKAPTKLNTTGGRYTFTYNTSTKLLKIRHKPTPEIVELFGDINVELVRSGTNSLIFTGSARIDAGTYNFKIKDQGAEMGFGFTFDDAVYGVQYNSKWSQATTFNATGGIYSIVYDTGTNKLTFKHAPNGLGEVRVFGDFNLPLASQGNNIYSASRIVEPGTYHFRIDALGQTLCSGLDFTNGINGVEFKADWKATTTLTSSKKQKFTFIFDANTNKLKALASPIEASKVLVAFEDSTLELTSTDGVNYTAITELQAGTYSFRMDEFGEILGYGGTYEDNINGIKYETRYVSATTVNATGGIYKFSYNVNTNGLKLKKLAD